MSTFDEREAQRTGYDYSETSGGSGPAWLLSAIVAVAILGMGLVWLVKNEKPAQIRAGFFIMLRAMNGFR
jgi:hypothetical protein